MTKTEYLYGTEEVPMIPKEIIEKRINILNRNLEKLLKVSYMKREQERINKILKAINFWKDLNSN